MHETFALNCCILRFLNHLRQSAEARLPTSPKGGEGPQGELTRYKYKPINILHYVSKNKMKCALFVIRLLSQAKRHPWEGNRASADI